MNRTSDNLEGQTTQAQLPKKKAWWRTKRAQWTFLLVFLAGGIGTALWYFLLFPFVSTEDARVAATTIRVANLGSSGQVTKVNVEEGMRVKKGDILLELDAREAQAKLEKAKAKADSSQRERSRAEQLLSQKGIAPNQFDKIQQEAVVADSEYRLAQIALERTYLKSPSDGLIAQKLTEEGNLLESGQTAITVVDIDNAWIAANIEETKVAAVRLGQPVTVFVDEGGEMSGKVSEIQSATAAQFALIPAENPSGNFIKLVQRIPVKVRLDPHPNQSLRVGESVEIKIRVK